MNLADDNAKILNEVIDVFRRYNNQGVGALTPVAMSICLALFTIEFATDFALYDGNVRLSKFLNDIMKGAFFIFLIHWLWPRMIGWTELFFVNAGIIAGGGSDMETHYPSDIINQGFKVCEELYKALTASAAEANRKVTVQMAKDIKINPDSETINLAREYGEKFKDAFHPLGMLMYILAIVMIMFAHVWIALQVFLCIIEYYIFTALATIFLPFGVCKHTKFLFDRTIQGLVNFGTKLMVLFFLVAVADKGINLMGQAPVEAGKQFSYYTKVGIVYLCLAYLIWVLPEKAGSLMQGSPSMSGKEALGTAMAAGGAVVGAGAAVAGAALTAGALKATATANTKAQSDASARLKSAEAASSAAQSRANSASSSMAYEKGNMDNFQRQMDAAAASGDQQAFMKAQAGFNKAQANYNASQTDFNHAQKDKASADSEARSVKEEMKGIGPTSFIGAVGTKVGAKVTNPWVSRRENLRRDHPQLRAFLTGDYKGIQRDY